MNYLHHDIGIAMLSVYDADGFLGLQVDGFGESQSGLQPYEVHGGTGGFYYRPDDPAVDSNGEPIPGQACQVLFGTEGGRGHAWVLNDPRSLSVLPQLKKGSSIQFARQGYSFHLIDGQSGSHIIYVPYGFDASGKNPSKSCSIAVNVDDPDAPFVSILVGDGTAIQLKDGAVTFRAANGKSFVTVAGDGTQVVGGLAVTGGVSLGSEAAGNLVLFEAFAMWAQALEKKVAASVVGPSPVPFETVAAQMATRFTKAS
ncbi:hypothetical protein LZC95_08070 [Pendulispora brunnea]|uniref:Uncharacterized protein n=1 Tax=Pendulispora brunnea TaxID=2905690 RepID=A0ABZ2KDV5_9BACT